MGHTLMGTDVCRDGRKLVGKHVLKTLAFWGKMTVPYKPHFMLRGKDQNEPLVVRNTQRTALL